MGRKSAMKFRALLPIIMAAAMIMAIIAGLASTQNAAYPDTGGSRELTLPYSGSVSTVVILFNCQHRYGKSGSRRNPLADGPADFVES